MNDHDPLEDRLRSALNEPDLGSRPDADEFLDAVHRGARRRRTRRVAGATAAVALVAVGGFAVVSNTVLDNQSSPVAANSNATAPSTSGASAATSTMATSLASSGNTATVTSVPVTDGMPVSLTATGTAYQWVLAAVDDKSCASAPCAVVYSTGDSGRSWSGATKLHVPLSTTAPQPSTVDQVRFVRPDVTAAADGWAFGGALLSSHDSGRTWHQVTGVPSGDVVTHLEAWGGYVYAAADGASPALLRSPVGMDRWTPVSVEGGTGHVQALATANGIAAFIDTSDNGLARIRVSTDDGATWVTGSPPCPDLASAQLSTSNSTLFMSCGTGQQSTVQITTDGLHWSNLAAPPQPFRLAAVTSGTALAVTASKVFALRAGSAPAARSPAPASDTIYAGFTNEQTGYLVDASGQMWRTADAGQHWAAYAVQP